MTCMCRAKTVLWIALMTSCAWAQEADVPLADEQVDYSVFSLEELFRVNVITASKQKEPLWDAPGVVTVLTEQEIQQFGGNNLWDLVDRLPSVQKNFSAAVNSTSIRGGEGFFQNHLLVLFDGRPFRSTNGNFSTYNAWATFPIHMIERIEIIRGPGSVLYGTNAFEGVINVITKKNKKNVLDARVKTGSFGTKNGDVYWHHKKNDLTIDLGAYFYKTDGWDFTSAVDSGTGPLLDENGNPVTFTQGVYEENLGIRGDLKYKDLTLSYYQGNLEHFAEVFFYGDNVYFTSDVTLLNLGYKKDLSEKYRLEINLTNNTEKFNWEWDLSAGPVIATKSNDKLVEVTFFGDLNDQVRFLVGAVAQKWESKNPPSLFGTDGDFPKENHLGFYTQFTYRPNRFVKLIGGAQLNKPEGLKEDIVPRLGVIWNFSPRTGMKFLYGQAFKSPVPQDRYIDSENVQLGFPGLKSEKITTYNIQFLYQGERQLIVLTAFDSKENNLLRLLPPTEADYEDFQPYYPLYDINTFLEYDFITKNQGEYNVKGFEVEAKFMPEERWFISSALSYQENEDENKVKNTSLAPSHLLKVGLGFTDNALSLGLFSSYYGEFKDNKIVNPDRIVLNPPSEAFNVVSFNGRYGWRYDKFDLNVEIYGTNLLDEEAYIHELPGDQRNTVPGLGGRSFYATLSTKF